jgi:ATP-dependent helicase/nuclease subunit B
MTKQKNILKVYPTSRAIREVAKSYQDNNIFLPTLMRIDEFEDRAISIDEDIIMVDKLERILILKSIASKDEFKSLNLNMDIVKFFTRSDAIFGFFEELALEKVGFDQLRVADAYLEFEEHIDILERLKERYKNALLQRGESDRAFIVNEYKTNTNFLLNFDLIEIYIEGYLSRFELELFDKISNIVKVVIKINTSRFTQKMYQRFLEYGVELVKNSQNTIDFSKKEILEFSSNIEIMNTKVYGVKEKFEQVGLAFILVQEMIERGIDPEKIAIVLPDESMVKIFDMYDKSNNLNFAMGFSYQNSKIYKSLKALLDYVKQRDDSNIDKLLKFGYDVPKIDHEKQYEVESFFEILENIRMIDFSLNISEVTNQNCQKCFEKYVHFVTIFKNEKLDFYSWLSLWLLDIGDVSIDDNRGGKVTVLGALETRGVIFDGVIVVDFNDGVVPSLPPKDMFLNSEVRNFASLPTRSDRESLQKQIYKRVLENSKESAVIYATSDDKMPALYISELQLDIPKNLDVSMEMFYDNKEMQCVELTKNIPFDATVISWSPTKLKVFLDCKRRFYYDYIKHIKTKDDDVSDGTLLHKIFEDTFKHDDYFEDANKLKKALIINIAKAYNANSAVDEYKRLLLIQKLEPFINMQISHFKSGYRIIEKEVEINGIIEGLRFGGRCDRIDQNSIGTLVIDYKSVDIKSVLKNSNDFQMVVYERLLYQKYKNLSLAYLQPFESKGFYQIDTSDERLEEFKNIINKIKDLKTIDTNMCEDETKCKFCSYRLLCARGEYR